jgi:putative ABC transport system permease protein
MRLGWKNILHDRLRFAITTVGIAFAVFLMVFQGSLLVGFLRAASKLVDAADADIWISARGVVCFDFSATLPRRFIEIARGIEGVETASRIATGHAEFRTSSGKHQSVALVGADATVGSRFPHPTLTPAADVTAPEAVLVDTSNAAALEVRSTPQEVEINQKRATVLRTVSGFGSFLGSPYVFTAYEDAARYLRLDPEDAMYILLRVKPGYSADAVRQAVALRLPDVDVWTAAEFSRRSRLYWVLQTGAGGGILIAAVLGFLVGLVIVSQTIYATTMENIEEFATLKALGAGRWFVSRVVVTQALLCGVVGCAIGLVATGPFVTLMRKPIPWVITPWWLLALMIPPSICMCGLASVASIRTALGTDPARVFRA